MITKKVFLKSSLLFLSMQVYGQNSLTVESMISLKRVSKPLSNVEGTKFIYDVNEVSIADNKGQKDLYLYDVNARTNVRLTETKYSEF